MTQWYAGWERPTLSYPGLPVTQFGKDVLNLWAQSTPLERWSNNPIGMPATGSNPRRVPGTQYALFYDITAFRQAFDKFLHGNKGQLLRAVFVSGESLSDAWREIHALKWPANMTETDYPAALLDRLEADHAKKLRSRTTGKRRTSGVISPQATTHQQVIAAHQAMTRAMKTQLETSAMIKQIVREVP